MKISRQPLLIRGGILNICFLIIFFLSSIGFAAPPQDEILAAESCRIDLKATSDYAKAGADVKKIKETLANALDKSEDMRTKVEEACKKQGGRIIVKVGRDNPTTHGGGNVVVPHRDRRGRVVRVHLEIEIDLGDIEKVPDHLTGDMELKEIASASWFTRILAHEIDHQRDSFEDIQKKRRKHADPVGKRAGEVGGPAVEDANLVKTQIGSLDVRIFYEREGKTILRHPETGGVVFDGLSWINQSKQVDKNNQRRTHGPSLPRDRFFFVPRTLLDVPNQPCNAENEGPCYHLPSETDPDLDGVPNFDPEGLPFDNCPELANPQQGDADANGIGDDCEFQDQLPLDDKCEETCSTQRLSCDESCIEPGLNCLNTCNEGYEMCGGDCSDSGFNCVAECQDDEQCISGCIETAQVCFSSCHETLLSCEVTCNDGEKTCQDECFVEETNCIGDCD